MRASAAPKPRWIVLALAFVAVAMAGCGERPAATPAPAPAPDSGSPAPTPAATASALPAAPTSAVAVGVEKAPVASASHDPEPSAACLAKTTKTATKPAPAIHRWVDAAGLTHYSDQAPSAGVSNHRVLEVQGLPGISVDATGYDGSLPADLQRRAVVDALGVQHVFSDVLGIDGPSDLGLKVVFVRDADAYARLVGAGVLAASAGAYVPPQRTIYVRMQDDDEVVFQVLRHEITHALIHELVGNLPVSLNEGLAEYFRRYRAAGMGGQIDIAADRTALIGAAPPGDGSDALVELLALAGPDFYAADRERRYLQAYALVALLMRDSDSSAVLHEVLARQRAEPCAPVAVEAVLDQRYAGGLAGLAADWAAFLRDPPVMVRTY
jgi:uncharacterized protein DUF4124